MTIYTKNIYHQDDHWWNMQRNEIGMKLKAQSITKHIHLNSPRTWKKHHDHLLVWKAAAATLTAKEDIWRNNGQGFASSGIGSFSPARYEAYMQWVSLKHTMGFKRIILQYSFVHKNQNERLPKLDKLPVQLMTHKKTIGIFTEIIFNSRALTNYCLKRTQTRIRDITQDG